MSWGRRRRWIVLAILLVGAAAGSLFLLPIAWTAWQVQELRPRVLEVPLMPPLTSPSSYEYRTRSLGDHAVLFDLSDRLRVVLLYPMTTRQPLGAGSSTSSGTFDSRGATMGIDDITLTVMPPEVMSTFQVGDRQLEFDRTVLIIDDSRHDLTEAPRVVWLEHSGTVYRVEPLIASTTTGG